MRYSWNHIPLRFINKLSQNLLGTQNLKFRADIQNLSLTGRDEYNGIILAFVFDELGRKNKGQKCFKKHHLRSEY